MKIASSRSLRWLPYRAMRRFAIANVCRLYQSPIDKMPRSPVPDGFTIEACSADQLRSHAHKLEYQIPERDFNMLDTGNAKYFAQKSSKRSSKRSC